MNLGYALGNVLTSSLSHICFHIQNTIYAVIDGLIFY